MTRQEEHQAAPVCVHCVHYFVTYEPANPHGCRFFGMKSRMIPAMVVKKESGQNCAAFEKKQVQGKSKRG